MAMQPVATTATASGTRVLKESRDMFFFNFNTFCKLILNLTLFFLSKLTLLATPIAMVAWQGANVATTGKADR